MQRPLHRPPGVRNNVARTVDEIMNREVLDIPADELAEDALQNILALGVSGAPVLDEAGRPQGIVSFRDLLTRRGASVADRMTRPAFTVQSGANIREAAAVMADAGVHRLPVVDGDGVCVGVLSLLDVVRGLIGVPASHPAAFPHLDLETGLAWTDDIPLETERLELAPDGPGVLVLIRGGAGVHETPFWAEATDRVRARLAELLAATEAELPELPELHGKGELRFRAAAIHDPRARDRVHEYLLGQIQLGLAPLRMHPAHRPRSG